MLTAPVPVIEDPIGGPSKNITRSAFRFEQAIQTLFSKKRAELEANGTALLQAHADQATGTRPNILKSIVVLY